MTSITSTAAELFQIEEFMAADIQLHQAALAVSDSFRLEWDDSTRTYTAGDREAMVTILIDDDTSIETGWEWTLHGSSLPTCSCTTAEQPQILRSVVEHLTSEPTGS